MTALIELSDVHVWYDQGGAARTHALRGVTVAASASDRVGLAGASGSGKSTLLQVLSRLRRPQQGNVRAAPGFQMPSLVFQFPERQLFAATVFEDVAYGLRESGVPGHTIETRVHAALAEVGLPPGDFAARPPFHLSGGEQRRVGLAGALAQQRPLVLFDEPTLGLDSEGIGRLQAILARLHERGVGYWVASHDADFVATTCNQLLVLDSGRVAYAGNTAAFWTDASRAEALQVPVPLRSQLAHSLRARGLQDLPALPDDSQLVAALTAYASLRPR